MTQQQELLAWAASKIQEAQRSKVYGTVTFYLEAGTITRSEKKETEKPGQREEKAA